MLNSSIRSGDPIPVANTTYEVPSDPKLGKDDDIDFSKNDSSPKANFTSSGRPPLSYGGTSRRDNKKLQKKRKRTRNLLSKAPLYVQKCGTASLLWTRFNNQAGRIDHRAHRMRCKSWRCPICPRFKARILYNRIMKVTDLRLAATLTTDPKDYRDEDEAESQLSTCFDKLRKRWRRAFREFEYFSVVEWCESRWPHLHLIVRRGPTLEEVIGALAKDAGLRATAFKLLRPAIKGNSRQRKRRRPDPEEAKRNFYNYCGIIKAKLPEKYPRLKQDLSANLDSERERLNKARRWNQASNAAELIRSLPNIVGRASTDIGTGDRETLTAALLKYWLDKHGVESGFGIVSDVSFIYETERAVNYVLSDVTKTYQIRNDYRRYLRRIRPSRRFFDGIVEDEQEAMLAFEVVTRELTDVLESVKAEGGTIDEESQQNEILLDPEGRPQSLSLEASSFTPKPEGRYDLSRFLGRVERDRNGNPVGTERNDIE